jgi:flagellar protein FliO/FliZ
MAFFGGMPFPAQFLLAFVVVLGLIGATAWLVRQLGGNRLGSTAVRGRQPRLAVVDYASVDGRRRLILVRRDYVEHLVMIGGPTDIVVESNIVRATAGVPARVPAVIDPLPRAIPIPDGAAANGSANGPANGAWPAQPEVSSRTQRDTFAAFADELSTPRNRPQANTRSQPVAPRPEAHREPRQENRQEARPDSRQESRLSAPQPAAEAPQSTDQALFEMAQQLEAALRKPVPKTDRNDAREPRPAAMPRTVSWVEPVTPADDAAAPQLPAVPFSPPRPARANVAEGMGSDAKPQASGKPLSDDLEQEMASLLGRSSAK